MSQPYLFDHLVMERWAVSALFDSGVPKVHDRLSGRGRVALLSHPNRHFLGHIRSPDRLRISHVTSLRNKPRRGMKASLFRLQGGAFGIDLASKKHGDRHFTEHIISPGVFSTSHLLTSTTFFRHFTDIRQTVFRQFYDILRTCSDMIRLFPTYSDTL
jgi:hypothetical protein